ncbi:TPA: hypothetical protein EYO57_29835 [Candidatus Poribacteria bacterium]|nr:hypothetical protein [Candidatus Poribacteria bacterium]HIC02761.1 hypothetical protein [Candidatus Poribacteria bacterium]HIO49202.1 hypothetical protein [Candidatus Poribacteria bacterium]HIO79170.1 hypothetical protein [Candidatus Poribacteria bacterium]
MFDLFKRILCAAFLFILFVSKTYVETNSQIPDLRKRKTGSDWPGFLGPTSDGKSPENFRLDPWSASGPPLVWRTKIGESYGAPTISRGRLFIFDRHQNFARLSCMRSENKEPLWQFEYPTDYKDIYGYNNGPRTCPVVDDDRVYIYGAKGILHCLNVLDGTLRWKIDTSSRFNVVPNFFGMGSTPIIEDRLLIAQVGGALPTKARDVYQAQGDITGNGSGIVAFDKMSGEVVYQITDELASYASPILTTIDRRRWCFMFARGGLVGFNPLTGQIDFQYPWRDRKLESVNASNPVVAGDTVFISEAYGVGSSALQVHPRGYKIIWHDSLSRRKKTMMLHWNTAIHHQGYLYGCSGRHTQGSSLRCIELQTGRVMWSDPINERTSLLYVNEHLISLGEFGRLMLIRVNPKKLDVLSSVQLSRQHGLKYPLWAAPVLSNGFLYIRSKDQLLCFDLTPSKN